MPPKCENPACRKDVQDVNIAPRNCATCGHSAVYCKVGCKRKGEKGHLRRCPGSRHRKRIQSNIDKRAQTAQPGTTDSNEGNTGNFGADDHNGRDGEDDDGDDDGEFPEDPNPAGQFLASHLEVLMCYKVASGEYFRKGTNFLSCFSLVDGVNRTSNGSRSRGRPLA